ncbi:putative L-aspartate dehydrogenase [Callorhinchus milii]|nr:putative L-aspartate dehydrogenase [Callorhinchus milii]
MERLGPGGRAGKQMTRRVGIVGYGSLGQYLVDMIVQAGAEQGLQLVFVWNRSQEKMRGRVPEELQLKDLNMFGDRKSDLILEVSHPQITKEFGERFLRNADFMAGSPTAFADPETDRRCRRASAQHGHTLYIPSGALWGASDIQKMADRGTLKCRGLYCVADPDLECGHTV